jgi:hypothetical protein
VGLWAGIALVVFAIIMVVSALVCCCVLRKKRDWSENELALISDENGRVAWKGPVLVKSLSIGPFMIPNETLAIDNDAFQPEKTRDSELSEFRWPTSEGSGFELEDLKGDESLSPVLREDRVWQSDGWKEWSRAGDAGQSGPASPGDRTSSEVRSPEEWRQSEFGGLHWGEMEWASEHPPDEEAEISY